VTFWTLINFAMFVALLGWGLVKFAPRFFEARSLDIQKAIKDATGLKIDADFRYSEIDKRMANLPAEVERLKAEARSNMQQVRERLLEETRQEGARIRASAVAEIEARLRDEMNTLGAIEESLARAREEAAGGMRSVDPNVRADLERALAAKDSQLIEGRLELARLRRDSEARQTQLEREISDLRARLDPGGSSSLSQEHSQGAQLILMHSMLANIRRRSARLRDELEGFRRRLDTLPPGALSSMLEEIGEDLAEFAK